MNDDDTAANEEEAKPHVLARPNHEPVWKPSLMVDVVVLAPIVCALPHIEPV